MPVVLLASVGNAGGNDQEVESNRGTAVLTKTRQRTVRPPLYKVVLLNDDYTPMEFVVALLEQVFKMPRERAISLMLAIHTKGVGVAGVYTHEIAETKAHQVMTIARNHEHPLRCTIERE